MKSLIRGLRLPRNFSVAEREDRPTVYIETSLEPHCVCASYLRRYRDGNYSDAFGVSSPSQYDTFCRITDTFIKAGSREEVNIGYVRFGFHQ